MKTNIQRIPYAWDSFGYASELIIIEFNYGKDDSEIDLLRKAVDKINEVKDIYGHPPSVGGQYDCTGQAFGSSFRKLDLQKNEGGFIVIIVHGWALDI